MRAGLSRRQVVALGGAAASVALLRGAYAQQPVLPEIKIGMVVPANTGLSTVRTSITDYAGEAARRGALQSEAEIGREAARAGGRIDLLMANTPIAEAARRAGERLVEAEGVQALIGGIGEGQAEVLGAVAAEARIPFLNIGSSRDALRQGNCSRYTFHVEASAAMYLDALVSAGAAENYRRWFVIHEDSDEGRALYDRAVKAVAKHSAGGEVAGAAAVIVEQPVYFAEMEDAIAAEADVLLLLVNPIDQIAFLVQQETSDLEAPAFAFPDVITQTRDYIASARFEAPLYNPRRRVALWETTLAANGADGFNGNYRSRWGESTDPTAWAAYHSVKMLFQAVLTTGTVEADALVQYFESPEAVFDVLKGPGVSFRPWDHQLRQPLFLLEVDQEAEWHREDLASRIGIARLASELPDPAAMAAGAADALDQFGDTAADSTCTF